MPNPQCEAWFNEGRWRFLIVHHIIGYESYSVEMRWGGPDWQTCERTIKMLNLQRAHPWNLSLAFCGGSERWWNDLQRDEAKAQLDKLRKSATKAGFKKWEPLP